MLCQTSLWHFVPPPPPGETPHAPTSFCKQKEAKTNIMHGYYDFFDKLNGAVSTAPLFYCAVVIIGWICMPPSAASIVWGIFVKSEIIENGLPTGSS